MRPSAHDPVRDSGTRYGRFYNRIPREDGLRNIFCPSLGCTRLELTERDAGHLRSIPWN